MSESFVIQAFCGSFGARVFIQPFRYNQKKVVHFYIKYFSEMILTLVKGGGMLKGE